MLHKLYTISSRPKTAATERWCREPVRSLKGLEVAIFNVQRYFPLFKRKFFGYGAYTLTPRKLVKRSNENVRLTEALTMGFIAKNTSIPVPRVIDVFEFKGETYLVQEFIDGHVLEDVWLKLTPDQQTSAVDQLKDYLDQLRALKPTEPGKVQAVDGRGLTDRRVSRGGEWGPFNTHEEFGDFSFRGLVKHNLEKYPDARELYAKVEGRKWKTVFAHGDFGPHNVLWKDGRIVAVIDWEFAGWFPEYWDYCRAWIVSGSVEHVARRYTCWKMLDKVIDRYPDELAVEIFLLQNFVGLDF